MPKARYPLSSYVYVAPGSVGEALPGLMYAELNDIPVRVDKVQGLNLDLNSCGGDCMTWILQCFACR